MPFRACDPVSEDDVHAFDFDPPAWRALRLRHKSTPFLKLPCCNSDVLLKTSNLGTQFFSHKPDFHCSTAPETAEHRNIKSLAVEVARRYGWTAKTEVSGVSPSGKAWRADVLAEKGQKSRIAIEIQWSKQSHEETHNRQTIYKESGIRCLWLFRQNDVPISRDIPASHVIGNLKDGFFSYNLPLRDFLAAVFERRFKYGIPLYHPAKVIIYTRNTTCWYRKCGAPTVLISKIKFDLGFKAYDFRIRDFNNYYGLTKLIRETEAVKKHPKIGQIKRRNSLGLKPYLSNGCVRCDRIFGHHYAFGNEVEEESLELCSLQVELTPDWQRLIEENWFAELDKHWRIMPANPISGRGS